jgi:ribosomal protein S27AE
MNKEKVAGYRVWRIHVNHENLLRLRELFRDFIEGKTKIETIMTYKEAWIEEWKTALVTREMAGRRTPPRYPPLFLLVLFIMPDGGMRGNNSAPVKIDLREGELRIPSYGIRAKLPQRLIKTLIEENEQNPRPKFVAMVTRKGLLRLVAFRYVAPSLSLPLRVITLDENSRFGYTIAIWDIENEVVMRGFEKMRPPNHGYRRQITALLQSFADKPSEEVRQQLAELLPEEVITTLTTEKAKELAIATRKKEKRLNNEFINELIKKVRASIREAREQGKNVLILIEPIGNNSLRGTALQGTLLRSRKRLQNLAVYEGALLRLVRASGKFCPRCGIKGTEVIHTKHSRVYECQKCGLRWDRDKGVLFNLFYRYFENVMKEECDDDSVLAERILSELEKWLEKHPNALAY